MPVARMIMITKGLLVRSIFSISSIMSVWGAVTIKRNPNFWLLLNTSGLLFVEAAFTFSRKRMGEWRWFCPSVFLYLLATLPSLWIIELQLLEDRLEYTERFHGVRSKCEASSVVHRNATSLQNLGIPGLTLPIHLQLNSWSVALQQSLIFVLIVGRWMLPKGKLSRDQLSQLLLVYIGIAADILEFSTEGLKLEEVRCNYERVMCVLGIWTWSLLQFTIGLTVTKARKPRVAGLGLRSEVKQSLNPVAACCETEVWGIMATIIMQDGPFLAMRLYLLIEVKAVNQMMIFFTCKNILILLLQLYRLAVIYLEKPHRAQHLMHIVRSKGHTLRSSGDNYGEDRDKTYKSNYMHHTPSKQKLLSSGDTLADQIEPLMKGKREKNAQPQSIRKIRRQNSNFKKNLNNDLNMPDTLIPKKDNVPTLFTVVSDVPAEPIKTRRRSSSGGRKTSKSLNQFEGKVPTICLPANQPSESKGNNIITKNKPEADPQDEGKLEKERSRRGQDTDSRDKKPRSPEERGVTFSLPGNTNIDNYSKRRKTSVPEKSVKKLPETLPLSLIGGRKTTASPCMLASHEEDAW